MAVLWAGIAQSVWRLATGWKFGDRIPVRARFSAPVQTGPGPTQPPAQCVLGIDRELSGRNVALTTHPMYRRD